MSGLRAAVGEYVRLNVEYNKLRVRSWLWPELLAQLTTMSTVVQSHAETIAELNRRISKLEP